MKMSVQLNKYIQNNIIGLEVKFDDNVVGNILEYNHETGMATIKLDKEKCDAIGFNPIAGKNIGLIL
jgi:hypothetical protein